VAYYGNEVIFLQLIATYNAQEPPLAFAPVFCALHAASASAFFFAFIVVFVVPIVAPGYTHVQVYSFSQDITIVAITNPTTANTILFIVHYLSNAQ
jgi:hypothetical protein